MLIIKIDTYIESDLLFTILYGHRPIGLSKVVDNIYLISKLEVEGDKKYGN